MKRENQAIIDFGKEHVSFRVPSSMKNIGSAIKKLDQFLKNYKVSEPSTSQAAIIL